eukprot:1154177-Pelagomonas_calceolata.AAC.1
MHRRSLQHWRITTQFGGWSVPANLSVPLGPRGVPSFCVTRMLSCGPLVLLWAVLLFSLYLSLVF